MHKLVLLVGVFSSAFAAQDLLTISEYNQVMDKTIKAVSEPILSKLPIGLRDYKLEIFPPRKTGNPNRLLIRYHPPRYNVILSDVKLKRVGSIEREGDCVIPNSNETTVILCTYKVKFYTFDAKGKNGEQFNERVTFTVKLATYQYKTSNKNEHLWRVWRPFAPGSGYHKSENIPSSEIKPYLDKLGRTAVNGFKEYIVSTFEDSFLNDDNLSLNFNKALKDLKLE